MTEQGQTPEVRKGDVVLCESVVRESDGKLVYRCRIGDCKWEYLTADEMFEHLKGHGYE